MVHGVAASENVDTEVSGTRRLLYSVGYCSLQYSYCLDLFTPGDDPPVYHRDHGEHAAYVKFPSLSKFLAWVKTP